MVIRVFLGSYSLVYKSRKICGSTRKREVRLALKTLPLELGEVYDRAFARIHQQRKSHASLALQALCWISHAKRPMLVDELRHALAVEPDTSLLDVENVCQAGTVLLVCCGLVVIDKESSTIRLAHYTIQEYLRSRQAYFFGKPETEIARACLTYLLFEDFATGPCRDDQSMNVRLQENPFL